MSLMCMCVCRRHKLGPKQHTHSGGITGHAKANLPGCLYLSARLWNAILNPTFPQVAFWSACIPKSSYVFVCKFRVKQRQYLLRSWMPYNRRGTDNTNGYCQGQRLLLQALSETRYDYLRNMVQENATKRLTHCRTHLMPKARPHLTAILYL